MSDTIIIYHNPKCSKSRAALEWLQQHQSDSRLTVVEYMNEPVNTATLLEILDELQMKPAELVRRSDTAFKELALNNASDEQLIKAMVENSALLERPIVRYNDCAAIGRPLDNIIELFD